MKEKKGRNLASKWVEARVVQLTIIITVYSLLVFTINVQHVAAERSREDLYMANIPLSADGGEREISIRIATNEDGTGTGQIRVNDDDDNGDNNGTAASQSESATSDQCGPNAKCCWQYTWPGHMDSIPEAENATCEYYKKQKRDETIACFDPMVFTVAKTDKVEGTPPDFAELEREASNNNWNVFCVMGSKSCVTFTYYSNSDKRMENQTKFCGIVTDTSGKRIENGCHRQNVDGSWREVCVCQGPRCNGAQSLKLTWPVILITLSCIFGLSNYFSF